MNIIEELRNLSSTTTKGFDTTKLDRVYNELLLPRLKHHAINFKNNKIRLTDNLYCPKARDLMKELFDGELNVQRLIETEMKPYLKDKGFNVIIWSPRYSVEITW